MNFGDSSRSGPDDDTMPGAVGGDGDSHQARSLRTQKPLQDIQDLIDKLAAVTQQLRYPSRRPGPVLGPGPEPAPEPARLGREAPQ